MVSEVPPLVHCGVPLMETEPADALPNVTDCRVLDPATLKLLKRIPTKDTPDCIEFTAVQ